MLKSYLTIGLRNLWKNRLFSFINVSGMAISLASSLIIALYVIDELQYDKHIRDVSLKYRVFVEMVTSDGRATKGATIPPPLGPAMVSEYGEVASSLRFLNIGSSVLLEVGEKKFTELNGAYADPTVFDMFSLEVIEGNVQTALKETYHIALSQSIARKYFAGKPAVGEVIHVNNTPFTVSAVYRDFPQQSHIRLKYMLAMEGLVKDIPGQMQTWGWQQFVTYIQVKPGTDAAALEAKVQELVQRKAPRKESDGYYYVPYLMPLAKVHLHASDHAGDIAVKGNAQTVYILMATAIFIIVIAILNFVNLSTARAVNRIKEVGVRKVAGAFRSQLVYQFIGESVIVAFVALLIAGLITEIALPALNTFTQKTIPTNIFLNVKIVALLISFAFFVGIASGAYPAFYLSGYKPAHILSNQYSVKSGKSLLRKGMVILQFMLSFFLITASLVVTEQHTFMRNKDMGFDKDNVVVLPLKNDMKQNLESVKNMFLDQPGVLNASVGYGLPGEAYSTTNIRDLVNDKDVTVTMMVVDHDYIKTLGLDLIAGRDFSRDFPSDNEEAFIISESASKILGHQKAGEALQHDLLWVRWLELTEKKGKVIGVVKDFHVNSVRENITPVVFHIYPPGYNWIALRISDDNIPATIDHLRKTWNKLNSEWPFEYKFLDDNFDNLYKTEEKLAKLFSFFTGFAIFVACLGLFGLVVYSTSQKYKEISIRKVLGADESTLLMQLGKSYMILIFIAFIVAIPFSYYLAHRWLEKFAFRIGITPVLFIKAGLLIITIAGLTVGIQSFKAARANPVDALKEQ